MVGKTFVAISAVLLAAGCGGGSAVSTTTGGGLVAVAPTPTPIPTATPTPTPPPTATPAGYILTKSRDGAEDLAASFDIALGLQPSWGTGAIPGIYNAEEGAFRFVCGGDGALAKDDPLVFFNQSGVSHLHQVWGNEKFDARTTPADLANNAATNCNATPYSLNRSSYWMPALLHDSGQAIRPDAVLVYYKRKTASSSFCNPASPKFIGICVGLPSQIRFIFGWDSSQPTAPVTGASWICSVGDGRHYANLDDLFNGGCPVGAMMYANTMAPNCWDGKYLDTPDHRSHMAYADYSRGDGNAHCPSSHPYLIPQQENKAQYTVTADMIGTRADGSKYSRVRLASDGMLPGAKPGATLHADYMEAWVTAAKALWTNNCIDKALDCSGGDLGNGKQLIGAARVTPGLPRVTIAS